MSEVESSPETSQEHSSAASGTTVAGRIVGRSVDGTLVSAARNCVCHSSFLPVSHQRKWSHYFEDWGCLICGRKKAMNHFSRGMCPHCHSKVADRLKASLKKRAQQNGPSAEEQMPAQA